MNVTFGVNTTSETINKTNATASDVAVGSVDSNLDNTAKAIQFAVDNATAENSTVRVGPGTYNGSVRIGTDGLTLKGPNDGVGGDSANRGDEATIKAYAGTIVVNAGNTSINGLEIDAAGSGGDDNQEFGDDSDDVAVFVGGMERTDFSNVTLSNNQIDATDSSTSGVVIEEIDNVTVKHNRFSDSDFISRSPGPSTLPIGVRTVKSAPDNLKITENTFDIGRGVEISTPTERISIEITGNDFNVYEHGVGIQNGQSELQVGDVDISKNTFTGGGAAQRYVTGFSPNALDIDAILNDQGNTFDRAVTVRDSSGDIAVDAIYSTIQGGVGAASSGQTVSVEPGTYESVSIPKNVTLASTNGADATTINASSDSPTVEVISDKISIDGFTLNGSVDNDVIESELGSGVLNVTNNTIRVNTDTGTTPDGESPYAVDSSSRITVLNNTITGDDKSTAYGLTTRGGSASDDSEIRDNDISSVGTGLQTRGASGVAVTGNTFTDISASAVFVTSANAEVTAYNISNNDISDVGNAVDLNANSNDISGVEINDNKFVNADQLDGFGAVEARENGGSITETVDATSNWWGAPSGPSGQGPGSGGAVSANVDFKPFYLDAAKQTLRVEVSDQSVTNASRVSVGGDGSATATVSGSEVQSTTVTFSSGSVANSVTVGEASAPTGNAQGSEPDTDVATFLDISADQEVDTSVDISVTVKSSTLSNAGVATENAVILHYVDGAWTELETKSSTNGGTVTLTATASSLSPFAVGAAKAEPSGGGDGGGSNFGGVFAAGDRSVSQRVYSGLIEEIRAEFTEPTTGAVTMQTVDGFPTAAPTPDGQVVSTFEITPPDDVANDPGTVGLTISRSAIDNANADPSDIQLVRYDDSSNSIDELATNVVSESGETIVLSAETSGFSTFGVVIADQQPTETETSESTETETAESTETEPSEQTQTSASTTTEEDNPGFGVLVTVVGLLGAALIAHRIRS
ncbi:PGF-pre-PGF domain-containing protein [Halorubrum sp. SD626R]|uniref:PGF-pre-PGF domain-containing protein n=1 Tax=Halorubrum sp. SD626R TaxID=1419722 RepID=UPI001F546012|nr:PGF-pre-PGF domain-containing protein [Halorubrum sp. SD626R]